MEISTIITFPQLVAWSAVLLIAYIMVQATCSNTEFGTEWTAGPRDEQRKPAGELAGRSARALRNFGETYPAFVGLALALAIADPASVIGRVGALIWFAARIVYLPLYLRGVPRIRSIVWGISFLGLILMFLPIAL